MTYSGSVVLEKKIFKWPHLIFAFFRLSPLWRGPGPLFEQFRIPLPKDDLCQVWLKLACWFWRRRFFKYFSVFLLFCDYLPLEKVNPFYLNNLESPSPKDDLCQVWLKLAQWFWRSRKCKSLWTDGRTDDGQQAIRIVHLSFQLRWAKNTEEIRTYCFVWNQQRFVWDGCLNDLKRTAGR
jgi:hypothetical protein